MVVLNILARKKLNKFILRLMHKEQSDNKQSLELIKEFKLLYEKCKPDKNYTGLCNHYGYMWRLLPIRQAFEKNDYTLALHELNTIIALDEIHQLRVKTTLTDLLDKYIR